MRILPDSFMGNSPGFQDPLYTPITRITVLIITKGLPLLNRLSNHSNSLIHITPLWECEMPLMMMTLPPDKMMKRQGTRNTVWKFHNFSITQNLREINFGDSRSAKFAISTHLESLYFDFYECLHYLKVGMGQINQIQSPLNGKNATFRTPRCSKIDFTYDLSDIKVMKFPNCEKETLKFLD